jgi:hypothetical protein
MGASADASLFETAAAQTDGLGRFTFPLVPVGNYILKSVNDPLPLRPASAPVVHEPTGAGGPGAWLTETVGVGPEGVKNLAFTLRPGFTVRGDMEFIGATPRPPDADIAKITLALRAAQPRARADIGGGGAQAAPAASGAFALVGLPPGRYLLRVLSVPAGFPWRVQSLIVNGRDVNDVPFDLADDVANVHIVFSDRPASVSGRVTSAEPGDAAAAVLLFPADRALWADARAMTRRFRLARTAASGDFRMADVPPGDYLVVAVLDTTTADWPDVSMLTKLMPEATSLRVAAGDASSISLIVKKVQ